MESVHWQEVLPLLLGRSPDARADTGLARALGPIWLLLGRSPDSRADTGLVRAHDSAARADAATSWAFPRRSSG